jgi:hypothetical protein
VSISTYPATQVAEKVLFVIPSEARDLLFFAKPKKKQIPRANPALRNDSLRVFPQPQKPALQKPFPKRWNSSHLVCLEQFRFRCEQNGAN